MNADDVPADFPQEFLGTVSGAQPKLLVQKNERGEYVSEAESRRAERWAICQDLCEQLVDYVDQHWDGDGSRLQYVEQVILAVASKRSRWGISEAEAEWIGEHLRARRAH